MRDPNAVHPIGFLESLCLHKDARNGLESNADYAVGQHGKAGKRIAAHPAEGQRARGRAKMRDREQMLPMRA